MAGAGTVRGVPRPRLRDPQDTLLAVTLVAFAAFLVVRGVEWSETVAVTVVGGVLVMIRPGTPPAGGR